MPKIKVEIEVPNVKYCRLVNTASTVKLVNIADMVQAILRVVLYLAAQ